jgi:hypothetical protein
MNSILKTCVAATQKTLLCSSLACSLAALIRTLHNCMRQTRNLKSNGLPPGVRQFLPALRLHLLPPRLRSDFLCRSQLPPFFNLYSLGCRGPHPHGIQVVALPVGCCEDPRKTSLWTDCCFGFLLCSPISSISRASVVRRPCVARYSVLLRGPP